MIVTLLVLTLVLTIEIGWLARCSHASPSS
jgi:hypothetical protein